ncbi:MAG: ion channel [Candidatus Kaiserbacteria bacterium]|nr:ion channel [Candidatus Kaiserbacteria bacterium]
MFLRAQRFAISATYSRIFHIVSVVFDVTSITYFIWSFFFLDAPLVHFEITLGVYFAVEYLLMFLASENGWRYVKHPLAVSNALIIIGYLAVPFSNFGFLRILRAFRIIHLYQLIPDFRLLTNRIILWEKFLAIIVHVFVLVFIITEAVFVLQAPINPEINMRFDAFYYTVNAITKVGDGDTIALVGVQGKIITLIIALISLSIFVQLLDMARSVQTIQLRKRRRLPKEIYSEHLCTYCDIKNREKMATAPKRKKRKKGRRGV